MYYMLGMCLAWGNLGYMPQAQMLVLYELDLLYIKPPAFHKKIKKSVIIDELLGL